jgi:small GTP-binding protein
MIQKAKVCLIGATAVGKTSLVARYVSSIFSDQYRTTIGVKIETRTVDRPMGRVDLVLWDISGEDEFQNVQPAYLRGMRGYLLVIDGTRRETLEVAISLEARVRHDVGPVPFVVVLNKDDLVADWEISDKDLEALIARGWPLIRASAKTGSGVERAFDLLVDAIFRSPTWT